MINIYKPFFTTNGGDHEIYKSMYENIISSNSKNQKFIEKVTQAERESVRKDTRFRIGIEYEMLRGNSNIDEIILELKKEGINKVKYFDSYHGGINYNGWRLEPDNSLGSNGIELISIPENIQNTFSHMSAVFKIMNRLGLYTTNKTGLHVNISKTHLKLTSKLDILKLSLFMEEGKVWKYFESRKNNQYTLSVIDAILEKGDVDSLSIQSTAKLDAISQDIKKVIPEEKYFGINLSKLQKQNYIEFRYLGGKDYEKDLNRLQSFIEEFCYLILLASDPDFKRKEYIQKLVRLKNKLLTKEPKEFVVYVEIAYGEGGTETYTEDEIFDETIRNTSSRSIEWGEFPKYAYDRELEDRLFKEYKNQIHYYIKYHFKKFETLSKDMFQEKIYRIEEDAFIRVNYNVIEYAPIDYEKIEDDIKDGYFESIEEIIKELTKYNKEYERLNMDEIKKIWEKYHDE